MRLRPASFVWVPISLALLHALFAAGYARVTPYWTGGVLLHQGRVYVPDVGAPDERQHVNYVRHVAEGKGIPVFDPKDPNLYENYQSHQPPLYYVLAAGWSRIAGVREFTSSEDGLRLRLLNALIGGEGVAGVYFLALWGTRRRDVAFYSAAFASLLPMNVALSGAVTNDPMLYTLCTWALAVAAKGLREGWTERLAALCGLLAGLAILDKTNAVALIVALPLAFFVTNPSGKRVMAARPLGVCLGVALALAIPWWIRNTALLGDPLAMRAFMEGFGTEDRQDQAMRFIQAVGPLAYWTEWVGWWTLRSLVGVFGYMDVFLPAAVYVVALAVFASLLASPYALLREEGARDSRGVRLLCAVFFLVVLALFLRFNAQYFQAQARYLLPAIGPMCLALGVGAAAWGRLAKALPYIPIVALLVLNLWILSWLPGEFEKRVGYAAALLRSELPSARIL